MNDQNIYATQWSRLRYREKFLGAVAVLAQGIEFGFIFAFWPIVMVFLGGLFYVSEWILRLFGINSFTSQAVLAFALVLIPILIPLVYLYSFLCPRCKQLFFVKSIRPQFKLGNGKQCPHCQLVREPSK